MGRDRFAIGLGAMILALACTAPLDPTLDPEFETTIGESFSLRVGQAVRLPDGSAIGFSAVVEDSRCPTQVMCVWAGDGVAELVVRRGETVRRDSLHTFTAKGRTTTVGDLVVELVELAPYPETPRTIPQSEYVLTIATSRAP